VIESGVATKAAHVEDDERFDGPTKLRIVGH
jgi:hypothetical protein